MNDDSSLREKLIYNYWKDKLSKYEALPVHHNLNGTQRASGTWKFVVKDAAVKYVDHISNGNPFAAYTVYLSLFTAVLYRYFSLDNVLIASSDIKYERANYRKDQLIFYHIALNSDLTINEIINQVLAELQQTYNYLGFEVKDLAEENENAVMPATGQLNLAFYADTVNEPSVLLDKAHLQLRFEEISPTEIIFELRYNESVFNRSFIEGLATHYCESISNLRHGIAKPLKMLRILTDQEEHRLLKGFNAEGVTYTSATTLVGLFERHAATHSDHIAVIYEDRALTYGELNALANQLGRCLQQQHGVKAGDIVGLLIERSEYLLIGILGILKAGAAYLSLDLSYPDERLTYMLSDAAVKSIVCQSEPGRLNKYSLVNLKKPGWKIFDRDNLERKPVSTDLALVIYTSGSTGKPKGVMIEHQSIVRLVWNTNYMNITSRDSILALSNLSFDASTFDIFCAIINGAQLVLASQDVPTELDLLALLIKGQRISLVFMTTALFNVVVDRALESLEGIKRVFFGGEQVSVEHVKAFVNRYGAGILTHAYGPAENTTYSTCFPVNEIPAEWTVPIGYPVSNTQVFILDAHQQLVPPGIEGEIYLGGTGLARGYLNQPELTTALFMENPFHPGTRMYRTGDRGRWLFSGAIEYLGRKDKQVKIRGHRIELGEIEHALERIKGIEQALVIVIENEQKGRKLAAYLRSQLISVADVRNELATHLPDYMIPAHFIQVASFPLTVNGKIDRDALPSPEKEMNSPYYAACTEQERVLVKTWEEVLAVSSISIKDNFFILGGDSIKAIQVSSRLHNAGYKLEVRQLLRSPVLEELALQLQPLGHLTSQGTVEGEVSLTPIQRYFFDQDSKVQHHFNQSLLLEGENLSKSMVEKVFRKLQSHHDALRMAYVFEDGNIIQFNQADTDHISIEEFDYRAMEPGKAVETMGAEAGRIQESIDLQQGPVFKVALFHLPASSRLLIVIHHLVIDGVSWRIILEDLGALLRQYQNNENLSLPHKTTSFQVWAEKLIAYARSEPLLSQRSYWLSQEGKNTQVLTLPRDYEIENNYTGETLSAGFELDKQETEQLLTVVHKAYRTEINDVLLTALAISLQRLYGGDHLLIGLEGHGREEIVQGIDVSRTVGWFTTIYPVILTLNEGKPLGYQLMKIKEQLRMVPQKGIGYGVLRYLTDSGHEWQLNPQLRFNYLGQFDTEIKQSGLQIATESSGRNIHPQWKRDSDWDITILVRGGRLCVALEYNRKQYKQEQVIRFLESYQQVLKELITHCVNQEQEQLTPSDLGNATLSLEQFDELFD